MLSFAIYIPLSSCSVQKMLMLIARSIIYIYIYILLQLESLQQGKGFTVKFQVRTPLNSSPLGKMAAISQKTFSDVYSQMISFVFWSEFHWSLCPIDNNTALVWIMAWCRIGAKPLSEPMLTRFTDAYMRHWGRWVNEALHRQVCYRPTARVYFSLHTSGTNYIKKWRCIY